MTARSFLVHRKITRRSYGADRRTRSSHSPLNTIADAATPRDVHPDLTVRFCDGYVNTQPTGYRDQHDVIHWAARPPWWYRSMNTGG
jgi:hypothetical protein